LAREALECWIMKGMDAAMNKFNVKKAAIS
jgi:hypothetical protein